MHANMYNHCNNIELFLFAAVVHSHTAILCIIMIVVSTSRYWWIGGEKISGTWYWKGITTSKVPINRSADSGWHYGHGDFDESPCMYYVTYGSDGSGNGWDSHSGHACSVNTYFICERRLWIR